MCTGVRWQQPRGRLREEKGCKARVRIALRGEHGSCWSSMGDAEGGSAGSQENKAAAAAAGAMEAEVGTGSGAAEAASRCQGRFCACTWHTTAQPVRPHLANSCAAPGSSSKVLMSRMRFRRSAAGGQAGQHRQAGWDLLMGSQSECSASSAAMVFGEQGRVDGGTTVCCYTASASSVRACSCVCVCLLVYVRACARVHV